MTGAVADDLPGRLRAIYQQLYSAYGPQGWWPGDTPFEIVVGAILTQSAAWANVEKALANLKDLGALSPRGIAQLSGEELARAVYPSGYFNAKARKMKAFVALLFQRFGGELEAMLDTPVGELRPTLLACHGIGPETADAILLYAAGWPTFVIDAYTRRLFRRLEIVPARDTYDAWQTLFESNLDADQELFGEYHALIVCHGKEACRREPRCHACPLLDICPTGQASASATR